MNRGCFWSILIATFFISSCLTISEDRFTNTKKLLRFYYVSFITNGLSYAEYAEDEKLLISLIWDPTVATAIHATVIDTKPHKKIYIKELRYDIDGQTGVLLSDFNNNFSRTYIVRDKNGEPLLDGDKNIYCSFSHLEMIKTRERINIDRIEGEVKEMTLTKVFSLDDGPLEIETSSGYEIEMSTGKEYTKATVDFFMVLRILTGEHSLFSI
jgi:hypothetical protein